MVREQTKAEIIEATRELFCHKGFHETRMDDIVEASNTSKGTLYYYFDNKQELFETMINSVISRLYQEITKITEKNLKVREKLAEIIAAIAEFYQENFEFTYATFMQTGSPDPEFENQLWIWQNKFLDKTEEVIIEGIEKGFLREKDSKLMARSFLGLTSFFGPSTIEDSYELETLVDFVLDLYLKGVETRNDSKSKLPES